MGGWIECVGDEEGGMEGRSEEGMWTGEYANNKNTNNNDIKN